MFEKELEELNQKSLLRTLRRINSAQGPRVKIDGREIILLSSNNYLGLANHPRVKEAAIRVIEKYGFGSGASRLISGNMTLHEELEERIADFKGTEAAILFNSGYTANIGIIPALVGKGDFIYSDELNHVSIIDGSRLSSAEIRIYPHKDMTVLEELLKKDKNNGRKLIVTDTVFSMDGDIAPLKDIYNLSQRYSAFLMVDEAHATGVLGSKGRGAVEHFALKGENIIQMGTLGKALGTFGAYIAGSKDLIVYLRNKARSFIYTTSLPPAVAAAAIEAINIIAEDNSLIKGLWDNRKVFIDGLHSLGFDTLSSETPIIPVLAGNIHKALEMAETLYEECIYAPAIRPPTVPEGSSRIRTTVMANHTKEDIEAALSAFRKIKNGKGSNNHRCVERTR
ncbi:MAG: 8-amino-7-oxononanoate synthase [Nitrospirota bacterium]